MAGYACGNCACQFVTGRQVPKKEFGSEKNFCMCLMISSRIYRNVEKADELSWLFDKKERQLGFQIVTFR